MSLGLSAAGWAAIGAIGVTGASLYGSSKASSAQEKAAQTAQAEQAREYDQTRTDTQALLAQQREDQAPYRDAGKGALAQIMAGLATGGQFAPGSNVMTLYGDPGYSFRQNQGEQAIQRAAAASGAGYSGATLKALARFNSGLASDEYGKAFDRNSTIYNRLAGVAGIGQTATNATQQAGTSANTMLGQLGGQYATNMGNLAMTAGEARASGYVAGSNTVGSGIKNLYNAYQAGPWMTPNPANYTAPPGSVENLLL